MKLTILDTKTNIRKEINSVFDATWWAEGNGSCDCNRATEMDRIDNGNREDEMEAVLREKYPELANRGGSYCFGSERFLIVRASSSEYLLAEFNGHYPDELVKRFIKREKD